MFSIECTVGSLVESRVTAIRSADEVTALGARFGEIARKIPEAPLVICGDYRSFGVLAPVVADRFLQMFRDANPRVRRSAVLVAPDSPTAALQIERIVQEAAHPSRRAFRAVDACIAWLDEVLSPAERVRMRTFLAGSSSPQGPR
jgi:hypothetical protein